MNRITVIGTVWTRTRAVRLICHFEFILSRWNKFCIRVFIIIIQNTLKRKGSRVCRGAFLDKSGDVECQNNVLFSKQIHRIYIGCTPRYNEGLPKNRIRLFVRFVQNSWATSPSLHLCLHYLYIIFFVNFINSTLYGMNITCNFRAK